MIYSLFFIMLYNNVILTSETVMNQQFRFGTVYSWNNEKPWESFHRHFMMPCIGHHSDINRSWLCRWFMLIKSGTLFTLIRYCIFDSQNFNLYFWTMNVTETNIIEDDRRIIPMKEITKDWLLISISIIIIGKSECRYFSRKNIPLYRRQGLTKIHE